MNDLQIESATTHFLRSLTHHLPNKTPLPQSSNYQKDPVQTALDFWMDWRKQVQSQTLARLLGTCNSPIERAMLLGILCVSTRWVEGTIFQFPDGSICPEGDTSANVLTIAPQHKIKPYTVDFFLTWTTVSVGHEEKIVGGRLRQFPFSTEERAHAVIECDGHTFHQRTPSQVNRDNEKNRFFQKMDYEVLRFSGSEIYEDPVGCAVKIRDGMVKPFRHAEKRPPQRTNQASPYEPK